MKIFDKLKRKYYEQEYLWQQVRKNLIDKDIRAVYRHLHV